ncbi:MAG: NAD(P)-dependent oxidoreductase [Gemmatimonadota bacterium]
MRIAVTGASGFIGGRVARALVRSGHEVLPFGRRPAAALSQMLPGYVAWNFAAGPIAAGHADAVVHCGARVGDWGLLSTYLEVNVDGTLAVLRSFPDAERFVHISTASVYASEHAREGLREDAPLETNARFPYALSKVGAERTVIENAPHAVVLRPHIVYGPGDTTLMPRVLAARRLGRLPVAGNGCNRLSITHVDNLVIAVERALTATVAGSFNVADAEAVTMDALLRTMLRRHGVRDSVSYIPRAIAWPVALALEFGWRVAGIAHAPPLTRFSVTNLADEFTLDLTRARECLGYVARWSYHDAHAHVEAGTTPQ